MTNNFVIKILLALNIFFSSSCVTVKNKFEPLENKKCDADYLLSAEVVFNDNINPDWPEPKKRRFFKFMEENACLSVNNKNAPQLILTFTITDNSPAQSVPKMLLDFTALVTLFTIIPAYRNRIKSIEFEVLDTASGRTKTYNSEVTYSELWHILALPIVPFREYKTSGDVLDKLILDLIRQARDDKFNL